MNMKMALNTQRHKCNTVDFSRFSERCNNISYHLSDEHKRICKIIRKNKELEIEVSQNGNVNGNTGYYVPFLPFNFNIARAVLHNVFKILAWFKTFALSAIMAT